ncbi:MAG: glycosyltransferase family 1 protein [Candidatus Lokiarchaeota archaeon]|nr:glycosyltransferase family 1 protein [Candidatus Lokiarchaeota archaeon]
MIAMKIFLVSIQFIPHITGGGGIVVRDLSLELVKAGDDVTVIALGLQDKEEEIIEIKDGTGIYPIKVKRFFTSDSKNIKDPYQGTKKEEFKRFEEFTNQVLNYLKDQNGIIHLHGHYEIPSLAKRIKEEGKKNPIIITYSALESIALESKRIIDDYALKYIKEKEEVGLRYCDIAIVNSEKVRAQLKSMYPNSFSEKKVIVLSNYVSNEHIYFKKFDDKDLLHVRRKYGISETNRLIYHIGRFDKIKGIEYLIQAMDLVSPKISDNISVLIVGFLEEKQIEYFDYLYKLAQEITSKNENLEIKFHPRAIEIDDRLSLLDTCSFFVTPAILEPFGLTTLEAWSRGKAVIRSDNEGSRFLFNIKNHIPTPYLKKPEGLIVNFESERTKNLSEAILYLLKNPEITKKMGELGRKLALQNYSWKKPIKIYRKIYQKIEKRNNKNIKINKN